MTTILILTHDRDESANMVLSHLGSLGVDVVRFNTEDFQSTVKVSMELTPSGIFHGKYLFPERELNFKDIGVVWNRRIHSPSISDDLEGGPAVRQLAIDEAEWGFNISITMIDAPVVNPWEVNERLKFNKWIQMRRATELGFESPASLLTNDTSSIIPFWQKVEHQMVFKKIRTGILQMEDGRKLILHTNRIPEEVLTTENVERMGFYPMFFQSLLEKKCDVRAVVVGEQVFSVTIDSQSVREGVTDYRTAAIQGKLAQMRHETIDLGDEINRRLITFTRSFGLTFSAIDLVITKDDRLVFLEDNPNGQWGWLEKLTGVPISRAIAELLCSLAKNKK